MIKILKTYLRVCLVLLPLSFLPIIIDAFGLGKNWLMLIMSLLGLIFWAVGVMIISKEDRIKVSRGWWWLLGLSIWATIFWFFGEAGLKMRSLLGVPGLGMMWSLTIWTFLWLQVSESRSENEEKWLTGAGLLVALSSLVVFLLPAAKLPISWPKENPLINITQDWTLVGSLLGEMWLLLILVILWVKKLMEKIKSREAYVLQLVVTAFLVLVLFLDIFKMVRAGWNYLDVNSSWSIATESLKYRPLQGVGIGNYIQAFNWWKPATFNAQKNWLGVFNWGANLGMQVWTEMGLIGLLMGVLAVLAFKKDQKNQRGKLMVIMLGILLALTPINFVALWLLMWLVTKNINTKEVRVVLKAGDEGKNAGPVILAVVVSGMAIFGGYWGVRVLMGEIYLRNSLVAAAKNDGNGTYNLQIKAIGINPNNAEYRQIYAQTNMALAGAILAKTDLTDTDKEQASTLIQQAVREGKAAVALDGGNPLYWSNLATIYRQLVGTIEGAADWSFQAYSQAIALDPNNPNLKLDFGGLLYAAGMYEDASRIFEQVVTLKPDLANGWYNLAYAEKKLNKLGLAVNHLNQAVSLVPVDSGDYDKASKELADWKEEYEAFIKQQEAAVEQAKEAETLKLPEALPTQGVEERVDIPAAELEPPKVEATPTVGE
ncbi:MAG: tetratricopeptide repeat protein [Candidatus Shapirobacteria bacterium]|nr:tetratricopeptide repeat protein [Candidatus Shapirobacteria bacterium]